MKRIFILGCERSGTTWLANALDAHAGVLFFMEPFADYIEIFSDIPQRNVYINQPNDEQLKSISSGFSRLKNMKYPLLYDIGRPLVLKKIDQTIFNLLEMFFRNLRLIKVPILIQRYIALNLNTSCISIHHQVKKHKQVFVQVIKELRLNFKIRLISKIFPDAMFLVSIRHPGAQISSIKRLLSLGTLAELRKNLTVFLKDIDQVPRFEKYDPIIDRYGKSGQIDNILILWWLINYEVLFEDLEKADLRWRLVEHEKISQSPEKEARSIFDFCHLDFSCDVGKYLIRSSRRRDHSIISNIDTVRDSLNYYLKCIQSVEPGLNEKIYEILNWHYKKSEQPEPYLHSYLNQYYEL